MDFFRKLFDSDFMPHGHCYFWRPEILWTHVLGDAFTALAYGIIPFGLYYYVRKRNDLKYPTIFVLFAVFIFSCGATHLLGIVSVWKPIYRLEGVVKVFTAVVSMITAVALIRLIPVALLIPSPSALVAVNQKLKRKSDELEQRNEVLTRISYATSHDMREPIRGITIYAQRLLKQKGNSLEPEVRETLEYIQDEGKRMYGMIDSLMNFAFLDSERFEFTRIELNDVMEAVKDNLKLLIEEHGVSVQHGSLPAVRGNHPLLSLLFQHIISNSIRFKGAEKPIIRISAAEENGMVKIELSDNGRGFDNKYREMVFEMFKRAHSAPELRSSGLGLSIGKRIAEMHGGSIAAQSAEGQGTTVFITLPAG